MKNIRPFILLIAFVATSNIATAQFYNTFQNPNINDRETGAAALSNGFVYGYTISGSRPAFHKNILLLKVNNAGTIVWSKTYDAGNGISLHLIEMITTTGNEILISAIISGDNNFENSQRCLLKVNAGGAIAWCKKYTGGNPYDYKGLAQLKDSSFVFSSAFGQSNMAILHAANSGKLMRSFKITNRQFTSVKSITAFGNSADIIAGNNNKVTINFTSDSITSQQQYNTSNQFTALISERCKNGDIIYLAGRTQGGVLSGTSRLFRTTANGTLLWAKNINAYFNKNNSPFSVFDIVQQVYVHEDINGNILACVLEESTQELVIAFNANGKYLYNRALAANLSFIKETTSGSYLNAAPISNSFFGNVFFANRFLSATFACDSSIIVKVTNGTDSVAIVDKLKFAAAKFTTADVPVTVQNTTLQPTVFCSNNFADKPAKHDEDNNISISPDPAFNSIIVRSKYNSPCRIYDMNGSLKITAASNQTIDISALTPGIYTAVIITKNTVIRKAFVKQ